MVNVTVIGTTAEISMMVDYGILGAHVYTAQVDLVVGILQNNHINIPGSFEMMWTYHDAGVSSAPGFELLPLSISIVAIVFVVKKRKY